ncbi:MAG TPA: molybdopterin cofactor-binding domain-containing protein [Lacipirellulaceae bacterium]|nr:molybdopterin cofactor-binding domain-containing protein [Lacipirellulaceae bacterium]
MTHAHRSAGERRTDAGQGRRVESIRNSQSEILDCEEIDYDELLEPIRFHFALDRRSFVQILGSGVLITAIGSPVFAQRRGGRRRGGFFGGPPAPLSARIHLADDGMITVFSGKVDAGQGARGEVAQAAAEELRVPLSQIRVLLGDTNDCPNDGLTAGSSTTPRTIPAVRQAAAAVRQLLVDSVAKKWDVEPRAIDARGGKLSHDATKREVTYVEAAKDEQLAQLFEKPAPADVQVTSVRQWKTLGTEHKPPAAREKVLGRHQYPTDLKRPGMLYGSVLRSPKYRAKLVSVDLTPARAMEGVIAVQDGQFVGVAAPSSFAAKQAIEAVAKTAKWGDISLPSTDQLYDYLRKNVEGGIPTNPFAAETAKGAKSLRATYTIAYVQHAPLEPRTALAEWTDGKLNVWAGTQNPFGMRRELMEAFRLPETAVHVIVPDFGSGYGGKHTGESAVEAARLARAAKKPVMLRWTREEEFTWAYFRPAAVIDLEASLDSRDKLATWYHVNINAGGSSVESPYDVPHKRSEALRSRAPLREGSYRALAATGNTFARESFMDELAVAAGADPLEFRLAHLSDNRLKDVLVEAARRFNWTERVKQKHRDRGIGLACSTDKGSYVACCAEVAVDRTANEIHVLDVCETFDCGPVLCPDNLRNQIEGAVTMGLGPALREEIRIEDGAIANASFGRYRVPHFADVPTIAVHAINRTGVPAAGAGETPIIAIAPAIGNAVFRATGIRLRSMPMKLSSAQA